MISEILTMTDRPTVYIVDDDPLLRESFSLLVRSKGFHAKRAHASAEEFLETFSQNKLPRRASFLTSDFVA